MLSPGAQIRPRVHIVMACGMMEGVEPLELGVGLGLWARSFLDDVIRWGEMDKQMHKLLCEALPFSVTELLRALESPPVQAYEIATQVRVLAQRRDLDRITDEYHPVLAELAALLSPVASDAQPLAAALGVPESVWSHLHVSFSLSDRERTHKLGVLTKAFFQWELLRDDPWGGQTVEELQEAVARSGASAATLERSASCWELELPSGCSSWEEYRSRLYDDISGNLLRQRQQHPDRLVPTEQVWLMLRRYCARPAFSLALDDATDPGFLAPGCRHLSGLLSLQRHVARLGADAAEISWSSLCCLARYGCMEPAFAAELVQGAPVPETVSRRLRPSDLLRLVEAHGADWVAWAVAAVLGALSPGAAGPESEQVSTQDLAIALWRRIYNRIPWLETGHLVRVLRLLGRDDFVAKLTAHSDSQHWPDASVGAHSARCARFMQLAEVLQQQHQERMQAFIARYAVAQRCSYSAPVGTPVRWRLLNSLALDGPLLRCWHLFAGPLQTEGRVEAQPQQQAGANVAAEPGMLVQPVGTEVGTDADRLARNAEGYPYDFVCPLTWEYMEDPVALPLARGKTAYVSKTSLLKALATGRHFNPLTGEPLLPAQAEGLELDLAHLARIHAWRRAHPELEEDAAAFMPPGARPPEAQPAEARHRPAEGDA